MLRNLIQIEEFIRTQIQEYLQDIILEKGRIIKYKKKNLKIENTIPQGIDHQVCQKEKSLKMDMGNSKPKTKKQENTKIYIIKHPIGQ